MATACGSYPFHRPALIVPVAMGSGPLMCIPRSCLFCRRQAVSHPLLCPRQDSGGVVLRGEFGGVVHRAASVDTLQCENDPAMQTRSPIGIQLVIERVPHDGVGKV